MSVRGRRWVAPSDCFASSHGVSSLEPLGQVGCHRHSRLVVLIRGAVRTMRVMDKLGCVDAVHVLSSFSDNHRTFPAARRILTRSRRGGGGSENAAEVKASHRVLVLFLLRFLGWALFLLWRLLGSVLSTLDFRCSGDSALLPWLLLHRL